MIDRGDGGSCPYENRQQLYTMHFFFAFASRVWQFGIVLFMAYLTNNSLELVALAGLASCLSVAVLAPFIGEALDATDRLVAARVTLFVKGISVFGGYLLCGILASMKTGPDPVTHWSLYLVPVLCAVAQVAFSTVPLFIEKDWIVVLSDGDSVWLSETNSTMKQIDLLCKSLAPAITGTVFASFTPEQDSIVLLLGNSVSVIMLYAFLRDVYLTRQPLQRRGKTTSGYNVVEEAEQLAMSDISSSSEAAIASKREGNSLQLFMGSGVALPMFAYSCLYLSVLTFGSIMIVYLRYRGMTDHSIGIHAGVAAIVGFMGSRTYPYFVAWGGTWNTALWSLWYQFILVAVACGSFIFEDSLSGTYLLIYSVIFSRCGLWLFDLSVGQIVQETIPEDIRGRVNGTWRSIYAVFDMMGFVMALLFTDPNDFFVLVLVSAGSVGCATVSFTVAYIWNAGTKVGDVKQEYESIPDSDF